VTVSTVRGDVLRNGGVRGYTVQITRERFKPTTSDVFPSADPFDRLMERKIEHTEKKSINIYLYLSTKFASKTRCHRGHHLSFTCRVFSRLVFLFVEFSLSASRGLKTNNAVNREGTLSLSLTLSPSLFSTTSLIRHYIRPNHSHRHHGSHKIR